MKRVYGVSLLLLILICSIKGQSIKSSEEKSVHSQNIQAKVFVTASGTDLRLSPMNKDSVLNFQTSDQPLERQPFIFVDPTVTFQTIVGIGGALTDASAEVFAKIPESVQNELLTAYYDAEKGIGYNMARTTIASCDFSSDMYAYIKDKDSTLSSFSVAHDEKYRIPLIKRAIKAAGGKLPMLVTPWSPPAWMKDNNNVLHGGKLLDIYNQTWANHFVKFINIYEKVGIPIWGVSSQNEPMATQKWESCVFKAKEEADFIKTYLGPTLEKNKLQDVKIIAWDHNRDLIYQRASTIMNDPEAAKYVWGFGFHWYETWSGGDMQFDNLRLVHEAFPDKHLIFTEGCVEKYNPKQVRDWRLGERYGYSMINDFNAGTVAWIDWNILLDENGGPNHVGNFCFSPVHANTKTGKLIYTNSYYYIGHFSKFVKPGAKRIACSSNRSSLETTAFVNPDGKITVVVLNRSNKLISYKLGLYGQAASISSLSHSITTIQMDIK